MSSAIAFEHVDVIFGREAQAALAMLDAGEGRDAIFQKTNALVAVHDANLAIEPGEICVLMGLSGSGKSSLLRCVNGLNRASRGRVLVHDRESAVDIASCDSATLRRLRMRRISMVFQQFALMPWRTIRENVGFGLEVRGTPKAENQRVVDEKLKLVRLQQWADKYPHELSGGMQQRVGLARAFATDADILLMDEPFSALDPLIREHLQDELLELQRSLRKTIVFVSHDLDEALKIGSRIAIMEAGRIVQQGPPEEIVTRPASDYVRQFVASMNPLNVLKANSLMRPIAELWRDPGDGALLLDRQGRARLRMDGAGRLASIRVDGSEARILPFQDDLEVDRLPPATLVAIPPDATMRTAILARGLAGRPLLVVEGEGAIVGVIDEAEIYRGMLREAAAQTPQHDGEAPQPAAAQA
ncbi:MAG: transporter ATP-binding protein [Rhodospirillales bacterium]|jgi:glycine betaine/proline transport system ATP-binding protein|nr:transporter ATP-binding protein [Rhodospirillales bacterium]